MRKYSFFIVLLVQILSCTKSGGQLDKKMIIIGMDGLDPKMAQSMMDAGELPHFKALAESGGFLPLQTSNPPQSPVAWSDFISGHNPGHHDVFDFINRNPETYLPEIGMTETRNVENKTIKDLWAGLSGPSVKTRRKGKSFWDYLSENNIPSTIIHCPVTFPAGPLKGNLLTGMGTPDIKGTQGIFSYFTTGDVNQKDIQGRVTQVQWKEKRIESIVTGPKTKKDGKIEEVTVPLHIENLGSGKIKITVQDQSHELAKGDWSPWIRIKFPLGFMKNITGICRFHLNQVEPEFSLYLTPVNIDPQSPAMKISHPDDYAKEVYEQIGNYYTQGMPYDTWALNEGRIDEETFLQMAYEIQSENLNHLDWELGRYKGGLLFAYFGITDLVSHMFWRYLDNNHPNHGKNTNPTVREAIPRVYKHMDGVLGDIMKKVPQDTAFIVLSDHGFGSFRRAAHVNSWLKENGYLTLIEGETEGKELFQNVDWHETRAYSLGFGGIYVNQFGRERDGIVYKGAESESLKKEISEKLMSWKDVDGSNLVKKVYRGEDLYSGPYLEKGPDLFIGFNKNFRASWQTALGAAPKGLIEDNMKAWGGDHLCDPSLVPGVLFSNQAIKASEPRLKDLAATILTYFGVKPAESMEGQNVF